MKIERIVLTTDFSECAEHAFAPAADLARKVGARIDLVHVSDFPPPPGAEIIGVSLSEYNRRLKERLEEAARSSVFEGVEVEAVLLEGYGVDALKRFQAERGHDLAALATHGHSGLRYLLLGSFTERVVRYFPCPVLALRGYEEKKEFRADTILFPFDFSDCARAALDAVRYFGTRFGGRIHLLHVLYRDLVPAMSFPAAEPGLAQDLGRYWEESEALARRELEAFAQAELGGLKVEVEVRADNPVHGIVECARERSIDLIILATHGRTGLRHALLGSVAERVVRKAPSSTLTVRPPPNAQ